MVRMVWGIALAMMLVAVAGIVQAAEESGTESSAAMNPGPARIFSAVQRLRSRLQDSGLTINLTYTGEAFRSFRLIPDNTIRYRGLADLRLALDTGKSGLWPNGEFFIEGQNGHGKNVAVNPAGRCFVYQQHRRIRLHRNQSIRLPAKLSGSKSADPAGKAGCQPNLRCEPLRR